MRIELIAMDLDGTTLDNRGHISQANVEAVRRACQSGVLVVPATGRAFHELPEELVAIEEIRYFVVSNGAMVMNREKECLYSNLIPFDVAAEILRVLEQYDVMPELYIHGRPVAEQSKMTVESFRYYNIHPKYFGVLKDTRMGVESVSAYLHQKRSDVEKCNLFFRHLEQRAAFMEKMEALSADVEVTSSMVNNVEVNCRGANKGSGLAHLCAALHILPDAVLAIGDSDNDVAMLRYAQASVAVANASDEVKKAAAFVTVSNEENAVARTLEKFVFHPSGNLAQGGEK